MKKKLYIVLLISTGLLFVLILAFSKKDPETVPGFKERQGRIGLSAEWLNTKKAIQGLLATLKQDPENTKAMLELSQAYIQEARVTGDHAYYDKAALELLDKLLKKEPKNFEGLCLKATVLLSQHHFAEGLEVAKTAQPINPDNAFIYGIMCDAYTELGNYKEAVKMADKMVSMRPDIRSYSRVSYLREIHGDMVGAIAAMKMAVSAGYPGLEQTEWARMILAHLYEMTGKPDSAEAQYNIALQERPDYAFAMAGLGKIAKSKGNYPAAIQQFEKASSLITEYSFKDELTDLYTLTNQPEKAKKSGNEVIEMLGANAGNEEDNAHGHYADKELAWAYLKTGNTSKAAEHALLEYNRRPNNIDICETMAWVYYKQGKTVEANKYIDKALVTRSVNPLLLCRAGIIKIKAGDTAKGNELIQQGLSINPFPDQQLKAEAQSLVKNS